MCELCTVRAVLDRELGALGDHRLLGLERMRLLDLAHSWSVRTHVQYQAKMKYVRNFERLHPGLVILRTPEPVHPSRGSEIPLMWAEEAYSLRPSTARAGRLDPSAHVSYGTIRQLRSAVSQFYTISMLSEQSGGLRLDQQRRLHLGQGRLTDDAALTYFTRGFSARLGTDTQPSMVLLDRHVRFMNQEFEAHYRNSHTGSSRRYWARAGLANLLLWLGWIRSGELFGLTGQDIQVTLPSDGPRKDLPAGMGCLLLRLREETKSDRTRRADVPIAYETASGYAPGVWLARLSANLPGGVSDGRPLFTQDDGTLWDSYYFRHTFLYPSLYRQQAAGDAYLRAFTGQGSNSIPAKFWSLHSWRRGARTHCARANNPGCLRKATTAEIYEHARWRRKRASEAIDMIYLDLPLLDRLKITYCCH